jgi:hypothetical protein
MLSLPTVNLPPFILLHALGLCTVGLYLLFNRSTSPHSSMLGISTVGLGLAYLSTCYMPIEQNVFIHASVPVRLILAALAAVKVIVGGNGVGRSEKRQLWIVALYDGGGALVLGWWLGVWDGRVVGLV